MRNREYKNYALFVSVLQCNLFKFRFLLTLFRMFVSLVPVQFDHLAQCCDQSKCSVEIPNHYIELGCKEIKDDKNCCTIRYILNVFKIDNFIIVNAICFEFIISTSVKVNKQLLIFFLRLIELNVQHSQPMVNAILKASHLQWVIDSKMQMHHFVRLPVSAPIEAGNCVFC